MKRKVLIMLAILISYFLWINGAWAGTVGYVDSGQNGTTGNGVVGVIYTGTSGTAVHGYATATSGTTYGGNFQSDSPDGGTGVNGMATATSGYTYGGQFLSSSVNGIGVRGYATATSGYTYGGYFYNSSTSGRAIYGVASATSGYTFGGYFRNYSTSGRGVQGYASATSGTTYGGVFQSKSTSGRGIQGYATATSGYTYGGVFRSNSTSGRGVYGWASATSGTTYGVIGIVNSPQGYGVYSKGNMKVVGNSYVTGSKSAVVKLNNGQSVSLYAVESSENWFEDFGSSTLKEGSAVVKIDPTFAETVNTDMAYHVFLTPNADCKGLYVTDKKGTSFEVRELNGGKSDISFSYRIVAKRKGYEDQRLAKVNEDEMTVIAKTEEENMHKDEAIELVSHVK